MKLSTKILSTLLISGCLLSQHASHATSVNAYVGASMGFQRSWGTLNGETFIDTRNIGGITLTNSYPGRMGQSDPVGNLFFEVDTKFTNCFSIGVRPYYQLNSFEATLDRNGSLSPAFAGAAITEDVKFSLQRRHAYGLLLVPKVPLKGASLYGLLGVEFSRFKAKISSSTHEPGASDIFTNFSKGASSSAAVLGIGIARELGDWSLFIEGQYKLYKTKTIQASFPDPSIANVNRSQSVKFSPKFASVMFGVKFKFI